jgi:hypothetical protein
MSGVTLDPVGSTNLYKPQQPGPGEMMLFLRYIKVIPPQPIELEETWSQSGTPASVGYFVFFNQMPTPAQTPLVEVALRELLPPDPKASGFTWVKYNPTAKAGTNLQLIQVQFTLALKLNQSDAPSVSQDVTVPLPDGMKSLGFAAGAPAFSTVDDANKIDGFVVTYPPLANTQTPNDVGIALPMTGGGVGCLTFSGLISRAGNNTPSSVVKTLVDVQIDPLKPFNSTRTFQIFTGRNYLLSQDQNGYHIAPA